MSVPAKFDISVAVLGTGYMGRQYIDIFRDLAREIIICAADDAGRALAEKYGLKFYDNFEKLFECEKPDIAAVCLPTPLHHPAAMCAMEHGVHVMCEKPFAHTVDQAREMVDTANERGLTLMVGHLLRFEGHYEFLKQCIEDERFGKLVHLDLFRDHATPTWSVGSWLSDVSQTGGIIKDLHIHDTDIMNWMLGVPDCVYATSNIHSCSTIYTYPGNVTATASGTWRNSGFMPSHGYDAVFEKASLKYDFDKIVYSGIPANISIDTENCLRKELTYFCECVTRGEKPVKCLPEDSLKSLIINDAEAASLRQRKLVYLEK